MKNKKYTDEQDFSLFDGQDEEISEVSTVKDTSDEVDENTDSESLSTVFTTDLSKTEEPYYDENDVVTTTEDEEIISDTEGESDGKDVTKADESSNNSDSSLPESEAIAESEAKKPSSQNEAKPRRIDSIFDFIELFVFTLAAVFLITSFFFKYSNVLGDSMQNTLQSGEKLVLTNFLYDPKPGDIVVIDDRSLSDPIVKRVIAVGGQTVKITSDAVYVDGEKLEEDYVLIDNCRTRDYHYSTEPCDALKSLVISYKKGEYYEIRVPKNEIFVMGDHRDNSSDSRDVGTLHEDSVLGKVVIRFFPFDKFGKID